MCMPMQQSNFNIFRKLQLIVKKKKWCKTEFKNYLGKRSFHTITSNDNTVPAICAPLLKEFT